jgi:hypothetical protein
LDRPSTSGLRGDCLSVVEGVIGDRVRASSGSALRPEQAR